MKLTGHPIIDTGLAVACKILNESDIKDLTEEELQKASQWFLANIEQIEKLKIFSAYWQNNPFMGKNISAKSKYLRELAMIVNSNQNNTKKHCQTCGAKNSFMSFSRTWFPLGGTPGTDPCTYPNFEGKHLCLTCSRAAVLMTIGCRFAGGKPYLVHVNDSKLLVKSVSKAFEIIKTLMAGTSAANTISDSPVTKGHSGFFEVLAQSILWNKSLGGFDRIPKEGATALQFSNSGTSPYLYQLVLPCGILEFFTELNASNTKKKFIEIFQWSATKDNVSLFNAIENQKSIAPIIYKYANYIGLSNISKEEIDVMKVYESVAIGKQERFEVMQQLAKRVCDMETAYYDSFIKQLSNISKRESLMDLIVKFTKSASSNLHLSSEELKVIYLDSPLEVSKMLYLLCVAENNKKETNKE